MPDTLTAPVATEAPVAPAPSIQAPAAPSQSVDLKSSPFSALDARARTAPAKPAAAPAKEGDAAAPDAAKKPDAAAAAPAKLALSKDDRTARDPKWYREEHARMKADTDKTVARIKELESKIAEAEASGKDVSVLSQRLAEREKQLDAIQGELRVAKREVSPEFKEKWDKPFNDSAAYAKSTIEQLTVTTEDGQQRAATWNDFAALYQMPINKASAMARQQFGDDAQLVVGALNELHKLDYQRNTALEGEKAKWKENQTREEAERIQRDGTYKQMVSVITDDLAKSNPDFQDQPGDEHNESRTLRSEGYQLFDQKPDSMKTAAIKSAYVRHIVGAHYPLIRERDGLRSQLKEAEATIAELRGNKPGPASRASTDKGGGETGESWADELRKVVPPGA